MLVQVAEQLQTLVESPTCTGVGVGELPHSIPGKLPHGMLGKLPHGMLGDDMLDRQHRLVAGAAGDDEDAADGAAAVEQFGSWE